MRYYTTIFDKNYLYQAIALFKSLKKFSGEFNLYTLCMDEIAYGTIKSLNFKGLIPISIGDLTTAEIQSHRERTTHGQFCWSCQPLVIQFVMEKYGHDVVTYLEADSLFFSNPECLFIEMGESSVTLVPHNFSSGYDNSQSAGKFCVQFNAFRNNEEGNAVLEFWKNSCFLYNKLRPLEYPGQLCLDEWPDKFNGVKVIENIGAGVAPWNIDKYKFNSKEDVPYVDDHPIVFYHFHEYGRLIDGSHYLGGYYIPNEVINIVYKKYIHEIREAKELIQNFSPSFNYQRTCSTPPNVRSAILNFGAASLSSYAHGIYKSMFKKVNIFHDDYF